MYNTVLITGLRLFKFMWDTPLTVVEYIQNNSVSANDKPNYIKTYMLYFVFSLYDIYYSWVKKN